MSAPTMWSDIVGQAVPGWAQLSERNRRMVRAKGHVNSGVHVDMDTGLVTRCDCGRPSR